MGNKKLSSLLLLLEKSKAYVIFVGKEARESRQFQLLFSLGTHPVHAKVNRLSASTLKGIYSFEFNCYESFSYGFGGFFFLFRYITQKTLK